MGLHDTPQHDRNQDDNRDDIPNDNSPPGNKRGGEGPEPGSIQSGDLGSLDEMAARPNGPSSRDVLREQFSTLVAEQFARCSNLNYEQVQQHFVAVLVANVSSSHFDDNLEFAQGQGCEIAHCCSQAARLARLIRCCAELDQTSRERGMAADLYSFLGDQVVFLKGMFHPKDLECALALSAMSVPPGVRSLGQVAQMAYRRAGKLLKKGGEGENAYQKSEFFGYLSHNVQDCIKGLQRVRMEMNFQAYGLHQRRPQSLLGLE